ncbi:phenylalanine--tRNA ligase subunit alpha [Candidatus Woesearchaeota archaeon]|nr:phenylalanine--tRNA ligase subunit alpha [Candidatus Woesearchaeota archaeon]
MPKKQVKTDILWIAKGLSQVEAAVLGSLKGRASLDDVCSATGLEEIKVMRAFQWLSNKGLVEIESSSADFISLDKNGVVYADKGLPEKRFLEAVRKKPLSLEEIGRAASLDKDELGVCIGSLKKKGAIIVLPGPRFSIQENGKNMLLKDSLEDRLIMKLGKGYMELSSLKPEEKFAFDELCKRPLIIKKAASKTKYAKLTPLGKEVASSDMGMGLLEKLTPGMLKDGSWKGGEFRRYDVRINVPRINGGRRHFVCDVVDYARRVWLDMGFEEMSGQYAQTSFWNFDALFTAQDHPVREMQDTFFIKSPSEGRLPDKRLVARVRAVHEGGGDTGSRGWGKPWDENEAKQNVLRTHTTVLSARTLASLKKSDLPKKFFAVGRNFRNETMDWSHLFEFNQFEGIVIDQDANFRHLLGYLKEFFRKIGFPEARFRPAHFPYTEPSVEIDVFHPVHKKWVELGGAGIFRPEVVKPLLGIDVPVLAWGPGLDRQLMEYFGLTDIRDLYRNDIGQLRRLKKWMK